MLVKVTNDLLIALDSICLPNLTLLDLSVTFDDFGVSDTALNWFKSYLSDCKQLVTMGGCRSEICLVQS